jgi:hypothetical protein
MLLSLKKAEATLKMPALKVSGLFFASLRIEVRRDISQ